MKIAYEDMQKSTIIPFKCIFMISIEMEVIKSEVTYILFSFHLYFPVILNLWKKWGVEWPGSER